MGITTKQLQQPDDYSEHTNKQTNKHSAPADLEPCDEVFGHSELGGRVPQEDLKAILQPQLVPDFLQPLLGQHGQLHRRHPNDQHVATAILVLSWTCDEVIHDAECFRCAVVPQRSHGGEGHQSLGILLDEQVAADHHAVQPRVPWGRHGSALARAKSQHCLKISQNAGLHSGEVTIFSSSAQRMKSSIFINKSFEQNFSAFGPSPELK